MTPSFRAILAARRSSAKIQYNDWVAVAMRSLCAALLVVFACSFAAAQQVTLDPESSQYHPTVPTITFHFDLPGGSPSHYTIAVEPSGSAAYRSNGGETNEATETSSGEPYLMRFVMSEASRQRVFKLAEKLGYFKGSFDYTKRPVANTGSKTLTYADPQRHFSTTYNYTENADIQELTRFFQAVSNTLEFGRRLAFMQRFDKLGLHGELQKMVQMADEQQLAEVQAVAPVLQKISKDTSVMHVARLNAERLLDRSANGNPSASR